MVLVLMRTAGPASVRTAQQRHDARVSRARIWRACSNERATPNTVGPLPDIAAPSAPAARSAALIRSISLPDLSLNFTQALLAVDCRVITPAIHCGLTP